MSISALVCATVGTFHIEVTSMSFICAHFRIALALANCRARLTCFAWNLRRTRLFVLIRVESTNFSLCIISIDVFHDWFDLYCKLSRVVRCPAINRMRPELFLSLRNERH